MLRTVTKNRENDRPRQFYEYGAFQSREVKVELWASNSGGETRARLQISAVDLTSGWRFDLPEKEVVLVENGSTEHRSGSCPQPGEAEAKDKSAPSGTVVLHAKLVDLSGNVLARYSDWPQPYKFLDLSDPGLEVVVEGEEVVVSSKKPVKGVWLDVEGDDEGINSVSRFWMATIGAHDFSWMFSRGIYSGWGLKGWEGRR